MASMVGYEEDSEEYKSFVCHYMILFDIITCQKNDAAKTSSTSE